MIWNFIIDRIKSNTVILNRLAKVSFDLFLFGQNLERVLLHFPPIQKLSLQFSQGSDAHCRQSSEPFPYITHKCLHKESLPHFPH